jgi:hypothetical protein
MKCQSCQSELNERTKFCLNCGTPVKPGNSSPDERSAEFDLKKPAPEVQAFDNERVPSDDEEITLVGEVSNPPSVSANHNQNTAGAQSFKVTWVLATFFGFLGADRFYLGKVGTGVLKLIGFGWFGVWWLLDLMRINKGTQKDSNGRNLSDADGFIGKARVISAVLIPIVLIVNIFLFAAFVAGSISPSAT